MLRKKRKVGLKNTRLRARDMGTKKDGNTSSTNIRRLANNPAAAGGILGVRKFGLGGVGSQSGVKAYQYGKGHKLLLEEDKNMDNSSDAGYDDNLSDNDRVIVVGGTSEYNTD